METIIKKNICEQYLEDAGRYSLYVNRMRSLPDVKDGLKPIHRRILYGAYLLKAFPDRPYDSKAIWGDGDKINKIMNNIQMVRTFLDVLK